MKVTTADVEFAFSKLQAHVYFDNYDLILRGRIATYKSQLSSNIKKFVAECKKNNAFENVLDSKLKLSVLPKKIETKSSKLPSNYYTNTNSLFGNEVSRPNIHCDFPVELHLIATIWLMRYGKFIERRIPKTSYGNRLSIDKNTGDIEGRSLFKPYFRQFQNWWSLAIRTTKNALKDKQSVTILNFDLKSFYHEVKFDFDRLEQILLKKFPDIKDDVTHTTLKKTHIAYRTLLKSVKPDIASHGNIVPLPIGLFTSHVFANFHLRSLDSFIKKECDPLYYGRYVDDVLIVVKNTVLQEKTIKRGLSQSNSTDIIKIYLKNYFSNLFITSLDTEAITFKIPSLKDLQLNMDKLFIYQFDQAHTPNLIEKFVEEQKERSSMFRFLSDEEDETFDDFESQTFESNFENVDLNKARFKNLEDNKYKLSTFLSKLIKRRIQRGEGYRENEIEKIRKYFKGSYLIKHYYFWEKIFTLLVVYKKKNEISLLVKEITKEINSIKVNNSKTSEFNVTAIAYKRSLRHHLKYALAMAIGLDTNILSQNQSLIKALKTILTDAERSRIQLSESVEVYFQKRNSIFRNTGLLRGAFVYYPLLQFTRFTQDYTIDLTDSDSIFKALDLDANDVDGIFTLHRVDFIPFRVKFWQVAVLLYYKNLFKLNKPVDNPWYTDQFSSNEILNNAFTLFYKINKPSVPEETLKAKFFESVKTDKKTREGSTIFPERRSENFYIQELNVPNSGEHQKTYRVAIINKYVNGRDYLSSLDGNPVKNPLKMEAFDRILDEVAQVKKCDLFVMPELSLPHRLIAKYINQVAITQIGCISGIEHLNIKNVGFNFVLTVLPLTIENDKDAIPVLRLKNHYAPEEEKCIWDRKMLVPKPNPYRYDLFQWRGLYFATYYCYELADVFHRSIFFSQVDAIFAPVWNQDTHYYNSLIDAATRDMHNYFIIVNTSQYGYSKISRPQDHVNKEKVIVKGGTEEGYDFTVLVGDLKVKELREFQKLDHQEQKKAKKKNPSIKFKATPPDFPKENVEKRENNENFYM